MRFVPGLYLSAGGTTASSVASIRGLTARQNVVLIDGRPAYDPFLGDLQLENLPVDNIAKIKVIKGPVDPVYGPHTIGTVINIVSKRGTAVPSTKGNISYEAHNTQGYRLELEAGKINSITIWRGVTDGATGSPWLTIFPLRQFKQINSVNNPHWRKGMCPEISGMILVQKIKWPCSSATTTPDKITR